MNIVGTRTLGSALADKVARFGGRRFLVAEDEQGAGRAWTWAELDRDVNRAANFLLSRGLRHGAAFNLHLGNCPEFLIFWLAAARTGTVMVPTNPTSTADEMRYILQHSEARLSVTEPRYAAACHAVASDCPALGGVVECRSRVSLLAGMSDVAPDVRVTSSDEVSMQYTSGTTSKPKGVLLTHANYLYGGEVMAKAMRVGPDDRHLIVLPLFHAGAQLHAFLPMLLAGGRVALMERFSASRFVDQAIRHKATLAALFAAPIRMLLAQPRTERDGATPLRAVSYAQNVTPGQFAEWHERFRAPLMQIWGMTETMSLPLMQPLDLPRKPMAMGMPVLGYECRVVDESGREVPPGAIGELIVRGEPGVSLMKGYFKNPEATAQTLRDGWLWSGDQAWMDEEGYFFFVDRKKDMIKRAGENVSASEVEETLKAHPAVFDAAVVGIPDPVRDQAIKAYVILKPEATGTKADELIAWCRSRLSAFKVPEVVEFLETFPRTSVGKVQKHLF
ncbi:MAG: AMP-binding protein [Candidatus Rokubacteria bacterium]|nr:AMP-binding protein [Candidatus Rokubacteria bacterium]MBI3826480.1 AMP-binding protein [Candidatus Rokubacteria bacterium]